MGQLIEVSATNFCGFHSFRLPLAKQGLVFINGINMDSDAASSNGACKTGLFKAIGWILYGKSIDNKYGDEVIHKGTKCARGEIAINEGDDRYLVIRERRKASPKLFLKKNDEKVKGSKADLQAIIDRLMGVDWDGFTNTAMYGQGDRDRFVYPTTKDSDRKRILHRILRTGIFELAFVEAKERRKRLKLVRLDLETEIASLTTRLDDQDLDAIKESIAEYDAESLTLAKAKAADANALGKAAKAAKSTVDVSALKAEASTLQARIATLGAKSKASVVKAKAARTDQRVASGLYQTAKAQLEADASSLELLEGDDCPTCTAPLAKGRGKAHRSALQARQGQLDADMCSAADDRQTASEAAEGHDEAAEGFRDTCDVRKRLLQAVETRIVSAKAVKAKAADLARQAREKADEARALKARKNPHTATLKAAKTKASELKRERKAKRAELKATGPQLAALEFWVRGYGPTGIPSFALDSVMPFLTERANNYLETLSDGDMSINFSTQRELKEGDVYRDEIGITWSIEGIEDYPPSGGQWKKMEIATNFAMMDLVATREGSHVNILCLDECLDGLDAEGRSRVVKLLHGMRNIRESIFVISHDPGFSEIFEKTVTVTKEDGVSRLAA